MKLFLLSISAIASLQAGLGAIRLPSWSENTITSFTTERCLVRPTSFYKDFGTFYQTLIKPQVAQYGFGTELNQSEVGNLNCFITKAVFGTHVLLCSMWPRYFGYEWTIENKEKNEFIGIIFAQLSDKYSSQHNKKYIEIGCFLHPKYQFQGYAMEVSKQLISLNP